MDKKIKVYQKRSDIAEKTIVWALSAFLFAGSAAIYVRESRPLAAITVEMGENTETLSLSEVEERLKEARKVSINTATAEEITLIPGIGPAISSRIVEYRRENGKFHTVDALLKVKGIGPAKLEKMREYVNID